MTAERDVVDDRPRVAADAALAALYDRLAAGGAAVLGTGVVEPDPLPSEGGDRWGISAVFAPDRWSPALTRAADELRRVLGPSHAVYRPGTLHVTLRQFESHRVHVDAGDRRVRSYRDVLARFAAATAPVAIAFRGLVATSTGLVVKGWPTADLAPLRLDLQARLEAAGVPTAGPERDRATLRASAHATLAIFGGPVERPHALAAFVADHADTDFGTCAFDALRLAGYRRTSASVELIDHGRFAFA